MLSFRPFPRILSRVFTCNDTVSKIWPWHDTGLFKTISVLAPWGCDLVIAINSRRQHPRDQTSVEQVLHPHHGSVGQIATTHGRCWPKWKCSRLLRAQRGRRVRPLWNSTGHLSKHKKPDCRKQFEVETSFSCVLKPLISNTQTCVEHGFGKKLG